MVDALYIIVALVLLSSPIWAEEIAKEAYRRDIRRRKDSQGNSDIQERIDKDIERVVELLRERDKTPGTSVADTVTLPDVESTEDEQDNEYIMNVAPDPTDTTWFICTRHDLPEPSAAEYRIMAALEQYNVQWAREVSFVGLQFTTYSYPRFDFYLPRYRVVIEYDGAYAHSSREQKKNDRSKEKFCKDNGIKVIRYHKKHYYHLQTHIDDLMKKLQVKRRYKKKNPQQ